MAAYTPIPDAETTPLRSDARPRSWRKAVAATAAAGLVIGAAAARATSAPPLAAELFSLDDCPDALASDVDPSVCAVADAEQCSYGCTGDVCQALCGDACDEGAGAVCALAAYANLDSVCPALGYCAGETPDDVQQWFQATWQGYLGATTASPAAPLTKAAKAGMPDWGSGDDDTSSTCDVYAWCTVCASSASCADVEWAAATAMRDLEKLERQCKSREACAEVGGAAARAAHGAVR